MYVRKVGPMLRKILVALLVGVVVWLLCKALGVVLPLLAWNVAVAIGGFFNNYATVIALLFAIFNFITGRPQIPA